MLGTHKEIVAEWLKRLRSGTTEQTRGALGINEKRCCLGVLADMAVEAGVIDSPTTKKQSLYSEETQRDVEVEALLYDGETGYLPASVARWAGMKGTKGSFNPVSSPYYATDLASCNDRKCTFPQIADLIEYFHEDIFVNEEV